MEAATKNEVICLYFNDKEEVIGQIIVRNGGVSNNFTSLF